MTYRIIIKHHFDSAHLLKNHVGKCARLHGHRWEVEFCFIFSEINPITNMTADFGDLKTILYELCAELDHDYLNVVLKTENPTAEFIAKWMYEEAVKFMGSLKLPEDTRLFYVAIDETPTNRVEYYGNWNRETN